VAAYESTTLRGHNPSHSLKHDFTILPSSLNTNPALLLFLLLLLPVLLLLLPTGETDKADHGGWGGHSGHHGGHYDMSE
jgi:hypothetical protein